MEAYRTAAGPRACGPWAWSKASRLHGPLTLLVSVGGLGAPTSGCAAPVRRSRTHAARSPARAGPRPRAAAGGGGGKQCSGRARLGRACKGDSRLAPAARPTAEGAACAPALRRPCASHEARSIPAPHLTARRPLSHRQQARWPELSEVAQFRAASGAPAGRLEWHPRLPLLAAGWRGGAGRARGRRKGRCTSTHETQTPRLRLSVQPRRRLTRAAAAAHPGDRRRRALGRRVAAAVRGRRPPRRRRRHGTGLERGRAAARGGRRGGQGERGGPRAAAAWGLPRARGSQG
jgi:hypothetical protein